MPDKAHALRKSFMVLCGLILASFVFLLGYSLGSNQAAVQMATNCDQAVSDIKTRLEGTGLFPPSGEMFVISGVVTAVGTDYLEIDVPQMINNPLEDPAPTLRKVLVDADTKILKSVPKTLEEIEADMRAFEAAQRKFDEAMRLGQDAVPPEPPSGAEHVAVEFTDVRYGDSVTVNAETDILRAESFEAAQILITSSVEPVELDLEVTEEEDAP